MYFCCRFVGTKNQIQRMSRYNDITELFGTMECDTLVPLYDIGISCGLPTENGDIPPEMILAPSELTRGRSVFFVQAMGDSMEGVDIYDGDWLMMESTNHFNLRDIVLARVNGEDIIKSYMVDEEGRHWLVPSNDKYDAIQLTEEMDVKFFGRMVWKMTRHCETTRNLYKAIERTLKKREQAQAESKPKELFYDDVADALIAIAPMVKAGRRWLGACRVLMDRGFIRKDRYDKFCELVCSILPHHPHLPKTAELQRMAVDCFSKPFDKWTDETAPVHGKHYIAYFEVGEAMLEKLP